MFGGGGGGAGPAKGILKKTNSNPHLATLDSLNVVDIRKYLKDRENLTSRTEGRRDEVDLTRAEDSPTQSLLSERSFAASEMTTATEPLSGQRMYRALSGQSLPDMEVYQARAQQQKQVHVRHFLDEIAKEGGKILHNSHFQPSNRRGAEAGRQNFRSKRFSRNLDKKEPSHFKAQVRATRTEYLDLSEVSRPTISTLSTTHMKEEHISQGVDAYQHGRRKETADGENREAETYTRLTDEDAGHRGGETQRKRRQSMEDLSQQQTTGIELARLLRVPPLHPEMRLIDPFLTM